jgi:hypothetical protein
MKIENKEKERKKKKELTSVGLNSLTPCYRPMTTHAAWSLASFGSAKWAWTRPTPVRHHPVALPRTRVASLSAVPTRQ